MTDYRWETHTDSNVKLEIPTSWKMTRDGDDKLTVSSPDGGIELAFDFVRHGAAEAEADEKALLGHLKDRMTDAKIVKPFAPKQQHGLHGNGLAGTGTRDGAAIEWFSVALGDGKGHGVVALAIAGAGKMAEHGEEMMRVIGSIQPAGAA